MTFISQYRQETQAQAAQLLAGSRLIQTSYGTVEFGEIGSGSTLILSHGTIGGYDSSMWLAGLLGQEFHYLAPSRFGYLRTPLPADPSPVAQAGQYAAMLDSLKIGRAAVLGLSAGGPSAIQFALRYPDRCMGLVMLSAISHRFADIPWFLKAVFFGVMKINFLPWLLFRLNPTSVFQTNGVSRALLRHISSDPEKMKLLRELATTSLLPALRRNGIKNDWVQATQMPPYPLAQINVPTLVVHAINDPIVPIEFGRFCATQIPAARLFEVEDGGHFCCITHREIIVPQIIRFLNTSLSW